MKKTKKNVKNETNLSLVKIKKYIHFKKKKEPSGLLRVKHLDHYFLLVKLTLELSKKVDYSKNYHRTSFSTCKHVMKFHPFS